MKKLCLICALVLGLLTGCGAVQDDTTPPPVEQTAETTLADVTALLGQTDAQTADALGGGAENWTADRSFFIGRIYETELLGAPVTVYTSCSDDADHTVAAVSVWISDGSAPVDEPTRDAWIAALDDYTGQTAQAAGPSEGGALSWRWVADERSFDLQLLGDILTLSIQPMVGELS